MRLVIVTDEGIIIEVDDRISEYDLSKEIARSVIVDKIDQTIKRIQRKAERKALAKRGKS